MPRHEESIVLSDDVKTSVMVNNSFVKGRMQNTK